MAARDRLFLLKCQTLSDKHSRAAGQLGVHSAGSAFLFREACLSGFVPRGAEADTNKVGQRTWRGTGTMENMSSCRRTKDPGRFSTQSTQAWPSDANYEHQSLLVMFLRAKPTLLHLPWSTSVLCPYLFAILFRSLFLAIVLEHVLNKEDRVNLIRRASE